MRDNQRSNEIGVELERSGLWKIQQLIYLGIKVLLENGGLVMQYSEFVKLLTQLEMEALITGDEQKDLLEFAEPILRAYEKH